MLLFTETKYYSISKYLTVKKHPICICRCIFCLGSGSYYFNYKGTHSIVLMALVDAQLRFVYVDAGTNGRVSDGGVWGKSRLKAVLEHGDLNLPPPKPLPGRTTAVPYVIVADEAFGLKPYLAKPFPSADLTDDRRICNYRSNPQIFSLFRIENLT